MQTVFRPVHPFQLLKMPPGVSDVDESGSRRYRRVRHDHHDVGVRCKHINKGCKVRVAHFHALERCCQLTAAELELLDDVTDLLEAMRVALLFTLVMRDHQESGPFEKKHLVRFDDLRKVAQVALELLHVRDQLVNNAGPGFVQRLVPDRRPEARAGKRTGQSLQVLLALFEYQIPLILLDQVHLVHETEDLGIGRVLQDGFQTRLVVVHVFLQLAALDVEHVDQHLHVAEDVVPLAREVVLHERVLAAAVPQVQHQVAQESHMRVLDVYCGSETTGVSGDVVREDDRPHARLSRAALTHQQHLLLHGCAGHFPLHLIA